MMNIYIHLNSPIHVLNGYYKSIVVYFQSLNQTMYQINLLLLIMLIPQFGGMISTPLIASTLTLNVDHDTNVFKVLERYRCLERYRQSRFKYMTTFL